MRNTLQLLAIRNLKMLEYTLRAYNYIRLHCLAFHNVIIEVFLCFCNFLILPHRSEQVVWAEPDKLVRLKLSCDQSQAKLSVLSVTKCAL